MHLYTSLGKPRTARKRQIYRQTDMHTDRYIDRHTYRQIEAGRHDLLWGASSGQFCSSKSSPDAWVTQSHNIINYILSCKLGCCISSFHAATGKNRSLFIVQLKARDVKWNIAWILSYPTRSRTRDPLHSSTTKLRYSSAIFSEPISS